MTSLINDIWTPLSDVVEIARGYDDVTGGQIDGMLKTARENNLIEGFQSESASRVSIAPVIVRNYETVPDTFLYGRKLMRRRWGHSYDELKPAYAKDVDDNRIKLIPGTRPFVPDELTLRIVDFGANWNRLLIRSGHSLRMEEIQKTQAGQLAVFEALFAVSQHPEWMQKMDPKKIPFVVMAALLLNVPDRADYAAWRCSPFVWRILDHSPWLPSKEIVALDARSIDQKLGYSAMPVVLEYKR